MSQEEKKEIQRLFAALLDKYLESTVDKLCRDIRDLCQIAIDCGSK